MGFHKGQYPSKYVKSKYVKITATVIIVVVALFNIVYNYNSFAKVRRAVSGIDGMFSVHFIDVGQGDAALLKSPEGEYALIDCGPTANGSYLVKYLSDVGVDSLDYVIITHPHEDHYGGFTEVMENFEIEELIIHEAFADVYPYDKFIRMAESSGTDVFFADEDRNFRLDGDVNIEMLVPEITDINDLNESSLCFRVSYGNRAFMFTGDAEADTESYLMSLGKNLEAYVLKAGHHGSSTSNTKRFVKSVDPEYAVVSCEKNNDYGHPHRETVTLFEKSDIKMLVTYESGNVVFVTDGNDITLIEGFLDRNLYAGVAS